MSTLKKNILLILIAILSFLGFLDAAYLTLEHYQGIIPPCVNGFGCDTVLASQFSTIFGIPVSLFGSIFFLFTMVLPILFIQTSKKILLKILFLAAIIGFLVSITLFLIQFLVLKSFCPYCLISEFIIFGIFLGAVRIYKRHD